MARFQKYDAELGDELIRFVTCGSSVTAARKRAGLTTYEFHRWRTSPREPYRTFQRELLKAEGTAQIQAEATVFTKDPKWWIRFVHGRARATAKDKPRTPPLPPDEQPVLSRKDARRLMNIVDEALTGNQELRELVAAKLMEASTEQFKQARHRAAPPMSLLILALVGFAFGGMGIGAAAVAALRPSPYSVATGSPEPIGIALKPPDAALPARGLPLANAPFSLQHTVALRWSTPQEILDMARVSWQRSWQPAIAGALLVAASAWLPGDAAADKEKPPELSAEQKKKNLESFEVVWQTVRDKHFDPKLGGLDWQAIHDELKPQVESAATAAEARAVMSKMLERLKQSHFAIISADSYKAVSPTKEKGGAGSAAEPAGSGSTGMDVRVVGQDALVVRVEADSPAKAAGVKPGWQILKIAGKELGPTLEKVRTAYKDSTQLDLRLARAVEARLHGSVGDKVSVTFRDGEDKETTLEIPLALAKGKAADFGIITGVHVRFASRMLDGNLGYLALNTFFDPITVMPQIEKAMTEFQKADGIILDLRGNPGGIAAMGVGIGNWFVQTPNLRIGTMTLRDGEFHFILNPRAEPFLGPLAILIDGSSASTSEFLAGGLQDLKRARIFGTRSAGAALPSQIVRLPNGDGFQYAVANYVSAGGQVLEGRGVKPDVEVQPQRSALLAGRDPVLDAAVEWLRSQKGK